MTKRENLPIPLTERTLVASTKGQHSLVARGMDALINIDNDTTYRQARKTYNEITDTGTISWAEHGERETPIGDVSENTLQKPVLNIMAYSHDRWLWSHDLSVISLPDDTITQAEAWLEKYTYFCDNPNDKILRGQFNPEGMNLARQIQLFLGPKLEVLYTPWHPDRKVKRGQDQPVSIDYWANYSTDCCSEVNIHKPLCLTEFIMEKCEESGDIAEIDEDYYQHFIDMDDEAMNKHIRHFIFSMKDYINDPDQWKTEKKLLDHLCSTLFLMMRGMMYFPNGGGQPVFAKPAYMPTDAEIKQLSARADSERYTILKMLWKILHEQANNKNIP